MGAAGRLAIATAIAACSAAGATGTPKEGTVQMQTDWVGEGDPLVLIGGGLTGRLGFELHVPRLAPARRVIRAQPLNVQHALEGRPLPDGYSVRMESRALAAAIDALGLDAPVDICGWSFGAVVALDFALEHPARVRTLTLIEPPAFWVLREHGHVDDEVRAELRFTGSLRGDITEERLESFIEHAALVPPGMSPRDLPQWPEWVRHRQALGNNFALIEHGDTRARVRSLRAPVLLVKGLGSQRFFHRIIDDLATDLPNAEVIELPGGHAPLIVSIDAFLDRLATFQAPARAR